MKIESLLIRQFRNISELNLKVHPGLNVLRGSNGQGKTNFLESIYLLTHGRSFRTSDHKGLIRKESGKGYFLEANIKKLDLKNKLQIRYENGKKNMNLNGQRFSSAQLRQNFSSVLFSPESLLVVKESASRRRELVDDLCMETQREQYNSFNR